MFKDDVAKSLKEMNATQWQLADAIGISEPTLTRWLRYQLTGEHLQRVQQGLATLVAKEGN